MGYSEPPAQALQLQIAPSSYQHASVGSAHCPTAASGPTGHAAGSAGVSAQSAAGCLTDQDRWRQSAWIRQFGRGSSPQLQSAAGYPMPVSANVQELPGAGGCSGHDGLGEPPEPGPLPPDRAPPLEPPAPGEPPSLRPAPAPPVGPSLAVASPHATNNSEEAAPATRPRAFSLRMPKSNAIHVPALVGA
jgi:hypothetical protein